MNLVNLPARDTRVQPSIPGCLSEEAGPCNSAALWPVSGQGSSTAGGRSVPERPKMQSTDHTPLTSLAGETRNKLSDTSSKSKRDPARSAAVRSQ